MTKLKVVSWNIGCRAETLKMLNGSGYDAALGSSRRARPSAGSRHFLSAWH